MPNRNNRKRAESFILDPAHDQPHPMDYFVWVLKAGERVIMVGYDHTEAKAGDARSSATWSRR